MSSITNSEPSVMVERHRLNKVGHVANGASACLVMLLTTQPMYTVKTFLMARTRFPPIGNVSHLLQLGYKGIGVNYMGSGPAEAAAFFGEHSFSKLFKEKSNTERVVVSLASGMVGSPFNTVAEGIMTRQQITRESLWQATRAIYNRGAVLGLLRGGVPTAFRDGVFNWGLFGGNRVLRDQINGRLVKKDAVKEVYLSAFTGALAGYLSTPFDLVRTRMQAPVGESRQKSMVEIIRGILQNEGVRSFFRGGGVRAVLIGSAVVVLTAAKNEIPRYLPESLYRS